MARVKITCWEGLPEVLTAQHIADYEGISRQSVYELLRRNPVYGGLANYEIGTAKRVEKADYAAWRAARKADRTKRFS